MKALDTDAAAQKPSWDFFCDLQTVWDTNLGSIKGNFYIFNIYIYIYYFYIFLLCPSHIKKERSSQST